MGEENGGAESASTGTTPKVDRPTRGEIIVLLIPVMGIVGGVVVGLSTSGWFEVVGYGFALGCFFLVPTFSDVVDARRRKKFSDSESGFGCKIFLNMALAAGLMAWILSKGKPACLGRADDEFLIFAAAAVTGLWGLARIRFRRWLRKRAKV